MSTFIDLIRVAVGRKERLDAPLPEGEWEKLTKLSDLHCVRAALSWGVENLPDDQKPPRKLWLQWVWTVDKVETANRRLEESLAELTSVFADAGFDCCLLKGLGVARMYPCPSRRQNGDLDLWVNVRDAVGGAAGDVRRRCRNAGDNTSRVLDFVRSRWKTGDVVYHHVDVKAFDDVDVEVHFHPSWLNAPLANARLQRWFDANRPVAVTGDSATDRCDTGECSAPSVGAGDSATDRCDPGECSAPVVGAGDSATDRCDTGECSAPSVGAGDSATDRCDPGECSAPVVGAGDSATDRCDTGECSAPSVGAGDSATDRCDPGECSAPVGPGAIAGCAVPGPRFNAVFALVHALRHLLDEGVGLRHMMDFYYVLMNCDGDDRSAVTPVLASLGMRRFAAAVMWVMGEVFGLERERMLCAPCESDGRFLLDEIMHSGNFGRADARNRHRAGESRFQRLLRKTRRQMRFVAIAPREVFWAPAFKLWQYFWRLSRRGFSGR